MTQGLSTAGYAARRWRQTRFTPRRSHLTLVAAATAVLAILPWTAPAANRVSVRLEGEVGRECALLQPGTTQGGASLDTNVQVGDITRPGHRDFAFTVHCNTPFEYRLEAEHGALTHKAVREAPASFVSAVPYGVTVRIPTDAVTIEDHCSGDSLRAGAVSCPFSNSGNGIAMDTAGRLTVAWKPEGIPIAGQYSDRLTITVSARQ